MHLVYTRASWTEEWTQERHLEPIAYERVALPSVDSAQFRYRHGDVKRRHRPDFLHYDPNTDRGGWYVQIRTLQNGTETPVWTGILETEAQTPHGGTGEQPAGDQQYQAWGLIHALDRYKITRATAELEGSKTKIDRVPPMNRRARYGGGYRRGNRSSSQYGAPENELSSEESYIYGPDGDLWTHGQYIQYLLTHHNHTDLPWELVGQTDALDQLITTYNGDNLTVKQWIDHLMPRQRGLVARVEVNDGVPQIAVNTVFGEPISIGDVTIPASTRTETLDFGPHRGIEEPTIRKKYSGKYDRVVVEGERRRVAATLLYGYGLEKGWTAAEEAEYRDASPEERRSDDLSHVYTRFRVPSNWDWHNWDDETAAPIQNEDGTLDTTSTATQWPTDRAFMRNLPIEDTTGDDSEPDRLHTPMVFAGTSEGLAQLDVGQDDIKLHPMYLVMLDRQMGFQLGPEVPHIMAKNHFSGESDIDPVIDYTTLMATVGIKLDQRVKIQNDINPSATNPRTLTLRVPQAHQWYVLPKTALKPTARTDELHDGGLVRDDSDQLRQLAALASGWYGRTRRAVSFTLDRIEPLAPVGAFVKAAFTGSWELGEIGTPVTSVRWDVEAGTTSYETDWHELDIRSIQEVAGMSDMRAVAEEIRRQRSEIEDLQERTGNLPVRTPTGTSGTGGGLLLEAQEDMTEDYDNTDETTIAATTYEAKPVLADGTLGDAMDVIRPPGVDIRSGQRGVLSISDDGLNVFELTPEYIEMRTDDPSSPAPGRHWGRSDL